MKMTAGIYKGIEISKVPNWYLKWIAENWSENNKINKQICKEADEELTHRIKYGVDI